jgi:hypothetical protein
MTRRGSAARYARALLDVAIEESIAERAERDLAAFAELFAQHPDLERALTHPAVPAARKRALTAAITARLGTAAPVGKSEPKRFPRSSATRSAAYAVDVDVAEVGTVISIGDGIARVHGVERAMAGEMLEFPHGVFGIALNLEEDSVGAVLLGDYRRSRKATGQAHRPHHLGAGRRRDARARRQRARPADRRQGADHTTQFCRSSASRRASSIGSRSRSRCRRASRPSTAWCRSAAASAS